MAAGTGTSGGMLPLATTWLAAGTGTGWVDGVTTKLTAAEHMYSVAGQEETRKEKSRTNRGRLGRVSPARMELR